MTVSRATVRTRLLELLLSGVPSAEEVVKYQKSDFQGKSPEVQIVSQGSERASFTAMGDKATLFLGVHIYVLHSDPDTGWTEAQAEDALDQVEFEIAKTISDNQVTDVWESIAWAAPSLINKVVLGGTPYLYEVMPLQMEVYK